MRKRLAINVSEEVYDVLTKISEEYGMSISSIGSMAIMTFLEQKKALNVLETLKELTNIKSVIEENK